MDHADRPDRPVTSAWVTVDLVIFTVRDDALQVLLVERGKEPFQGRTALPGGYVGTDEGLEQAARRELWEETGVDSHDLHLEQLGGYGTPGRDPRGRVVTVAYLALGPEMPEPVAGTDARRAHWTPVEKALDDEGRHLAFDHAVILRDALERARKQLEYTTIASAFCTEPFTISELRHVYEVVWGQPLDPSNFRRKVLKAERFVVATGQRTASVAGRPAALYRRGEKKLLVPALLRAGEE
ncbi:NUDIX domain-containing protein [Nocardiopsis mangrovi]|uniref:NUDIX domain-containing protein n=1 Tax=Nocardiopsis mangrovi TaxID=1179818 RepID=A0ABV9DS71_9ACTN